MAVIRMSDDVHAVRARWAPPGCYLVVEDQVVWPVVIYRDEDGLVQGECDCDDEGACVHVRSAIVDMTKHTYTESS